MRKQLIVLVIALLNANLLYAQAPVPPALTAQISRPTYTDETTLKISGVKYLSEINFLGNTSKITKRNFVDGLGRPLQEIEFGRGNVANPDVVSFFVYDKYGNQKKKYLPYAVNSNKAYQNSAVVAQTAFYATSNSGGKYAKDDAPYRESEFDNSPLNSILKEGSEGTAWQLSTDKVNRNVTRTNTETDYVRQFNADGTSSGFWLAGSLIASELTDEDGHKVLSFSDKEGKLILLRNLIDETIQGNYSEYKETYHVYNYIGLKTMILPPNVTFRVKNSNWLLSADDLDHNVYRNEYDAKGRLIAKKIPSSGWTYMIYDKLDRLCLIQTPVQRQTNKWSFVKYDKLARKVLEGVLQDNSHTSRLLMQAHCDTYDYHNVAISTNESRGGMQMGYSDICFPQSSGGFNSYEIFSAYYYDSYDTDNNGTANYTYINQNLGNEEPVPGSSQGSATVITSRKLGTSDWITKIYFYDNDGQIIQEQSNNATNSSISDIQTNIFDFGGLLIRSLKKKTISGVQHVLEELLTYDDGKVISVTNKYNGNAPVTIAEYVYNELGQIVDKNLGKLTEGGTIDADKSLGVADAVLSGQSKAVYASNSITLTDGFYAQQGSNFIASIVAPSGFLQSVDYKYNVRGWLTHINNPDLNNDGYNTETNDVFGMEFLYQNSDAIGNTGLYNGRVSGLKWKSKMPAHPFDNIGRAYTYGYDKLGHLRNAMFKGNNGSGWSYRNDTFSEKGISYDLNGNVLSLERNMMNVGGTTVVMDNLVYQYKTTGGSDKLLQVNDSYGGAGAYGFQGASSEADEYIYDEAGNLGQDKNKGASYTYNEIGKVDRITLPGTNNYIQYTYTGNGQYLSKQVVSNGNALNTTSFADEFVAVDNVLSYITTIEGRIRTSGGNGTYEYFIKDNQGNVRTSFENQSGGAKVIQENSYYAFGLVHNATIIPSGANKRLYNDGSHWENDFSNNPDLFNTPQRQYDPVLGRFNAIDVIADEFADFNGYNYAFNNPISYNDPTGAYPDAPPGTYYPGDPIFQQWMQDNWGLFNTGGTYEQYYGVGGYMLNEVTIYGRNNNIWGSDMFRTSSFDNWQKNASTLPGNTIGQPGFGEGLIPIWGSGRSAIDHFQQGNYWRGTGYTALAITDIALVKAALTAVAKGTITLAGKFALKQAVKNPKFVGREAAALKKPAVAALMKGKGIDRAFREVAKKNLILGPAQKIGLITISPMNKGADLVGKGVLNGYWWDVTTKGAWESHVIKYGQGGTGLFY